jgi:hypothetical protein
MSVDDRLRDGAAGLNATEVAVPPFRRARRMHRVRVAVTATTAFFVAVAVAAGALAASGSRRSDSITVQPAVPVDRTWCVAVSHDEAIRDAVVHESVRPHFGQSINRAKLVMGSDVVAGSEFDKRGVSMRAKYWVVERQRPSNSDGAYAWELVLVPADGTPSPATIVESGPRNAGPTHGDAPRYFNALPDQSSECSAGSLLSFREVLGTIPYGTATASTCEGGRRVTVPAEQTPDAHILLADAKKTSCYELGPTLLTETGSVSADAVMNDTSSVWQVDVRFANDDFVKKVATPEVGKQIAIVLDGVVQSAPTVNQGITGRDVTITGNYDEAAARDVAARIDPSSRSRVPETPTTTATDALLNTFSQQCEAVAPRLVLGHSISGVTMPSVDMVRSGFERAHEAVPAELINLDGRQRIAFCSFTPAIAGPDTSPTTVCPNGDHADIGPIAPEITYVVDTNLHAFRFPGTDYLLPAGMTVPAGPEPCAGLGAP